VEVGTEVEGTDRVPARTVLRFRSLVAYVSFHNTKMIKA